MINQQIPISLNQPRIIEKEIERQEFKGKSKIIKTNGFTNLFKKALLF